MAVGHRIVKLFICKINTVTTFQLWEVLGLVCLKFFLCSVIYLLEWSSLSLILKWKETRKIKMCLCVVIYGYKCYTVETVFSLFSGTILFCLWLFQQVRNDEMVFYLVKYFFSILFPLAVRSSTTKALYQHPEEGTK